MLLCSDVVVSALCLGWAERACARLIRCLAKFESNLHRKITKIIIKENIAYALPPATGANVEYEPTDNQKCHFLKYQAKS